MLRAAQNDSKDLYGLIDPRLCKTDIWYFGECTFVDMLYNCFAKGKSKWHF